MVADHRPGAFWGASLIAIARRRRAGFVDASWNQSWTGTTQVRQFRIEGKYLYIKTLPARNPLTGKESTSKLVWVRGE
jgi:hypothetical protein